jgi:hypothetical protein
VYEQFIAYARNFADNVETYKSEDSHVAGAVDSLATVPGDICGAAIYGSAKSQLSLIPAPEAPSRVSPIGDPSNPQRFLTTSDPVCADWLSSFEAFDGDTAAWRAIDPNTPATQWTPEQRAVVDSVGPVMTRYADKVEELGRRTENPVLKDFAVTSGQYRRAYVVALPTYMPPDNYLVSASTYLAMAINAACSSV